VVTHSQPFGGQEYETVSVDGGAVTQEHGRIVVVTVGPQVVKGWAQAISGQAP